MLGLGEQDYVKRHGYLTEAVRAFETVMLLEPDNRQAKFYLSACFLDWGLGRYDEGVSYLRELAASTTEDNWSEQARVALSDVYSESNPSRNVS
jgi:thioredoxin-like negative regulator of GroEL